MSKLWFRYCSRLHCQLCVCGWCIRTQCSLAERVSSCILKVHSSNLRRVRPWPDGCAWRNCQVPQLHCCWATAVSCQILSISTFDAILTASLNKRPGHFSPPKYLFIDVLNVPCWRNKSRVLSVWLTEPHFSAHCYGKHTVVLYVVYSTWLFAKFCRKYQSDTLTAEMNQKLTHIRPTVLVRLCDVIADVRIHKDGTDNFKMVYEEAWRVSTCWMMTKQKTLCLWTWKLLIGRC